MARRIKMAPSVICADLADLRDDIYQLEEAGCDVLHFDIMDGDFIGTFAFGPDTIAALRQYTKLPFEVHLLTEKPERFIDMAAAAGADIIVVPVEACKNAADVVEEIRRRAKAGLAFYPPTPVDVVLPVLDRLEVCVVMTMEQGYPFRGRPFAMSQLENIRTLRREIDARGLRAGIEVDGAIRLDTAKLCRDAGADIIVAGTAIFKHPGGYADAFRLLRGED